MLIFQFDDCSWMFSCQITVLHRSPKRNIFFGCLRPWLHHPSCWPAVYGYLLKKMSFLTVVRMNIVGVSCSLNRNPALYFITNEKNSKHLSRLIWVLKQSSPALLCRYINLIIVEEHRWYARFSLKISPCLIAMLDRTSEWADFHVVKFPCVFMKGIPNLNPITKTTRSFIP